MKVPTGTAMMPYASGIFQYCLLYACPQPGRMADLRVAIFGSCLRTLSLPLLYVSSLSITTVPWFCENREPFIKKKNSSRQTVERMAQA